jgi:hypothetical protein
MDEHRAVLRPADLEVEQPAVGEGERRHGADVAMRRRTLGEACDLAPFPIVGAGDLVVRG